MVLAAGAGRRLRPDTDVLPKTLLPVAGRTTILDIALRNLAAVGLREVVVVVGHGAAMISERAADLEGAHGVALTLVHNHRAQEWNNAYSLWLAREYFARGVLLVNGDTVHPVSVEKTLLAAQAERQGAERQGAERQGAERQGAERQGAERQGAGLPGVILAVDNVKRLGDEEMKVVLDERGLLAKITKKMDPALAFGEYIGATLIGPAAAAPLASALEATWRHDPGLYYEDGYQELADRGEAVGVAAIGALDWVEVDNHEDLRRARQIATHC